MLPLSSSTWLCLGASSAAWAHLLEIYSCLPHHCAALKLLQQVIFRKWQSRDRAFPKMFIHKNFSPTQTLTLFWMESHVPENIGKIVKTNVCHPQVFLTWFILFVLHHAPPQMINGRPLMFIQQIRAHGFHKCSTTFSNAFQNVFCLWNNE